MHKNYDEGSGDLAIVLHMKIEQKLSEYFNMTGIEVKHLKEFWNKPSVLEGVWIKF